MSHPTHRTATRADVCPSAHLGSHASASETHARLMDAAKAEAGRLRHQAVCEFGNGVVDDFWRGANAVWQRMGDASAQATRSARRLQARLTRRHSPQRTG